MTAFHYFIYLFAFSEFSSSVSVGHEFPEAL
jgi:hypothetical protein